MSVIDELRKKKAKNRERLKKRVKNYNPITDTVAMPFRGAGHLAKAAVDTATMPFRGAKNLAKLAVGTVKTGAKIGYSATDKAIKGAKSLAKGANEQGKRDKERRKKLKIGEFAEKPGSKKTTKTKPTSKNKNKLTFGQGVKAAETKSTAKSKPKDDGGKAAWLKKTRNSPAAKSGAFTDDERWALQQKHRKWKADRKTRSETKKHANKGSRKGTHGKSLPSNPQQKTQTTKDKRDPNRHSLKPEDKKKKKPLFSKLSKSFD